jgi:hypothetical protein
MKIYEAHNNEGQLIYFEVPNILLSRKSAVNIIKEMPNVEILKEDKRDDIFCIFKLGGTVFEIMEPFGDNSRYHIGEPKARSSQELQMIKESFAAHKPGLLSILGR